jgi:hypothetical protein
MWQESADGSRNKLELALQPDGSYLASAADPGGPLFARVEGVSKLGNRIARDYGPVYAPGAERPEPPAEPQPQPEREPEPVAEPVAPDSPAEQGAESPQDAEQGSGGWLIPTIAFAAVNLLLLLAGLVFWWLRRRAGGDDEEIDLLLDDEQEPDAATAAGSPEQAPAGEPDSK